MEKRTSGYQKRPFSSPKRRSRRLIREPGVCFLTRLLAILNFTQKKKKKKKQP
jgi:hypothetical protein